MNRISAEQDRQRSMNPTTLATLAATGSDLTIPHRIVHVFHAFEEVAIPSLRGELEASGYSLETEGKPMSHAGQSYWQIEACNNAIPTLAILNAITDQCVMIASRHSVEYDGWYTEVTRGGSTISREET